MINKFNQNENDFICWTTFVRIQWIAKSAENQVWTQTSAGYNKYVQGDRSINNRRKITIEIILQNKPIDDDKGSIGFNWYKVVQSEVKNPRIIKILNRNRR